MVLHFSPKLSMTVDITFLPKFPLPHFVSFSFTSLLSYKTQAMSLRPERWRNEITGLFSYVQILSCSCAGKIMQIILHLLTPYSKEPTALLSRGTGTHTSIFCLILITKICDILEKARRQQIFFPFPFPCYRKC